MDVSDGTVLLKWIIARTGAFWALACGNLGFKFRIMPLARSTSHVLQQLLCCVPLKLPRGKACNVAHRDRPVSKHVFCTARADTSTLIAFCRTPSTYLCIAFPVAHGYSLSFRYAVN